jgi:hypothetical protein
MSSENNLERAAYNMSAFAQACRPAGQVGLMNKANQHL